MTTIERGDEMFLSVGVVLVPSGRQAGGRKKMEER